MSIPRESLFSTLLAKAGIVNKVASGHVIAEGFGFK
jgi:hypothetical protein